MNSFRRNYLDTRFFITRFNKACKSFKQQLSKSKNAVKGTVFEDYVRSVLFPKSDFNLVHRTPDYDPEDCQDTIKLPDFLFEFRADRSHKIAIEAKYISAFNTTYREFASKQQYDRHNKFQKIEDVKVFVVFGVGGSPYKPNEVFIVPLKRLAFNKVKYDWLKEKAFEVQREKVNLVTLATISNPEKTKEFISSKETY